MGGWRRDVGAQSSTQASVCRRQSWRCCGEISICVEQLWKVGVAMVRCVRTRAGDCVRTRARHARIMLNLSEVLNIPPYITCSSELAERSLLLRASLLTFRAGGPAGTLLRSPSNCTKVFRKIRSLPPFFARLGTCIKERDPSRVCPSRTRAHGAHHGPRHHTRF